MKRLIVVLLVIAVTLALGGCDNAPAVAQAGPQAWIDAPLDGSSLPLAPLEVISHAADLAGIAQVELSVNGAVINTMPVKNTGETLVTVTQEWTPANPGNYTLQVRAQNAPGVWGGYAQAVVTIGGEITPPPPSSTEEATAEATAEATEEETAEAETTEAPGDTPSPTATSTESCTYDSAFLADLSIPDDTEMAPGTPFSKGWRMQNNGNCDWGSGFQLVFVAGNQMGGPGAISVPPTAAGATTDLFVNLVAPGVPGSYTGRWQIFTPDGTPIGDRPWVRIVVPEEATEEPSPEPTEEPSPEPTEEPSPEPTEEPTPPPCQMIAPVLLRPINGTVVPTLTPTLEWGYRSTQCVPEAYRVEIATDAGFNNIVQSGSPHGTSWTPGHILQDCRTHYWRVAGIRDSKRGPYSETQSFFVFCVVK
jgi:hypothetical protein